MADFANSPSDQGLEDDETDWSIAWDDGTLTTNMPSNSFQSDISNVKMKLMQPDGATNKQALKKTDVSPKKTRSSSVSDSKLVSRLTLNDNKAGMEGLDREKINQIIYEASKGSKYFENELKKEEQVNKRIQEQERKINKLSDNLIQQGEEIADALLSDLESNRNLSRTIVHVDMDAFYAAVEMRENPSLKHKPMAVGGNNMLSTSNYLARRYGVRAAMPGFIAKKLCPDLIIVSTSFDKYRAVSQDVRSVLVQYDANMCPMSLDEAYLDITEHVEKRREYSEEERTFKRQLTEDEVCQCCSSSKGLDKPKCLDVSIDTSEIKTDQGSSEINPDSLEQGNRSEQDQEKGEKCVDCNRYRKGYEEIITFGVSVEETVREMRFRIQQKTSLTASAGIAPNMMLAKVCSDKNKPNGQYVIPATKQAVFDFIKDLPIRKISGIGKVSEKMLSAIGLVTCSDLFNQRGLLYHLYSNISFNYFMRICLGIGSTKVERDGERKSMSVERTFSEINKPAELFKKCHELCESLSDDLKDEELMGKTVTLKIKLSNFEVRSRANTIVNYTNDMNVIYNAAREVLRSEIQSLAPEPLRLRLMGVRLSNLLHQRHVGDHRQKTITSLFKTFQTKTQHVSPAGSPLKTQAAEVSDHGEAISIGDRLKIDDTINTTLLEEKSADVGYNNDQISTDASTCTKDQEKANSEELSNDQLILSINILSVKKETKNMIKGAFPEQHSHSDTGGGDMKTVNMSTNGSHNQTNSIPISTFGLVCYLKHDYSEGYTTAVYEDPMSNPNPSDQTDTVDQESTVVNHPLVTETKSNVLPNPHSFSASIECEIVAQHLSSHEKTHSNEMSVQDSTADIQNVFYENEAISSQSKTAPCLENKFKLPENVITFIGRKTPTPAINEPALNTSSGNEFNETVCQRTESTLGSSVDKVSEAAEACITQDLPSTNQHQQLQQFDCPVCSKTKSFPDMKSFMNHIDECLTVKCIENDEINHNEISAKSRNAKNKNVSSVVSIKHKENPESGSDDQIFICPICNAPQRRANLVLFNQHMDACLNRQTIKEIIQDPVATPNRKRGCSEGKNSPRTSNKKPRIEPYTGGNTSTKGTLHGFFKSTNR